MALTPQQSAIILLDVLNDILETTGNLNLKKNGLTHLQIKTILFDVKATEKPVQSNTARPTGQQGV